MKTQADEKSEAMTNKERIKAIQRILFPDSPKEWDGIPGKKWQAALNFLIDVPDVQTPETPQTGSGGAVAGAVDSRSEAAIATLLPQVRVLARQLVLLAAHNGIIIKVTSGNRTYEEQDALYAQGRTVPGKIVTNARAGSSWHNQACAFDVTLFRNGQPVWESPDYTAVGKLGQSIGLEWGGAWTSIKDEPHFQVTNGKTLAEARELHSLGKNVFS